MSIAVLYLARFAEGAEPVRRFIRSYQAHPAGEAHNLVVIKKGFPDGPLPEGYDALRDSAIDQSISFDDSGVDITAYGKAAQVLQHKYVVVFNTFAEIVADDWLAKLHRAIQKPGIGLAAAMGSNESLFSSWTDINRVLFHCMNGMPYEPGLANELESEIKKHVPAWLDLQEGQSLKPGYDKAEVDKAFFDFWTSPANEQYHAFRQIPGFPNPHVRTNGVMIERERFLATRPYAVYDKPSSLLYESGPDGLTKKILHMGLKPIIVGADATEYSFETMSLSNTFRLDGQQNLLITDNQTRAFAEASAAAKRFLTWASWQSASLSEAAGLTDLNVALRNLLDGRKKSEAVADELQKENDSLRDYAAQLQAEAQRLRDQHNALINSASWRITRPLRFILPALRRLQ